MLMLMMLFSEGDWKVTLDTIENLENGQVALVVYGDKGQSGPIMLTPPVKNGPAYRAGSSDEFKVGTGGGDRGTVSSL